MLKFEFDEEKRDIFLNFWKIKKVSDFKRITDKPQLFFLRLCSLNDVGLKFLGQLAGYHLREKIDDYPPSPIETTGSYIAETEEGSNVIREIIEMLDSINLINPWQTEAGENLSGKRLASDPFVSEKLQEVFSSCHLTPEFEKCLKALARPPFSGSPPLPDPELFKKLSREEKKVLDHFMEFYGFSNNRILPYHTEEVLLSLQEKGLIDFLFLSKRFTPSIVVNPLIYQKDYLKEKNSSLGNQPFNCFPKEEAVESLFFLQALKFEQVSTNIQTKYYPTSQEKRQFLEDIFQKLAELPQNQEAEYFSKIDFNQKMLFLHKKLFPKTIDFLGILFSQDSEPVLSLLTNGFTDKQITYEANKQGFLLDPSGERQFLSEEINQILYGWEMLGLVVKKNKVYYPDQDSLKELGESVGDTGKTSAKSLKLSESLNQSIIIDSDYTLVAPKEQLRTSDIFFLHHFCDLKVSSHLVRGQLNTEKSSLAWYFGITEERLADFLKSRSGSTWQKNFQEMLEIYFEHTPFFKPSATIKLTTPSKNFFFTLKYFLNENGFNSGITLIEEEKTFIFHDQETFDKVKAAFPDPAPIKIFE